MDLIKEIEKNNYELEYSENGAKCYQNLKGIVKLEKDQIFIGKYLHKVCCGLNDEELKNFEAMFNIKLNKDLIKFYKKYNGFHFFSGSFDIFGFGRICKDGCYFVSRDPDICLPYHLLDYNEKINEEAIVIGSILDNKLYYNNKTGIVTLDNEGKIEKWKNLDDCIEDIYHRLYVQYLPNGIAKNPKIKKKLVFNEPEKL